MEDTKDEIIKAYLQVFYDLGFSELGQGIQGDNKIAFRPLMGSWCLQLIEHRLIIYDVDKNSKKIGEVDITDPKSIPKAVRMVINELFHHSKTISKFIVNLNRLNDIERGRCEI